MLRDGSIDVMNGRTDDIFVPFLEGYHFVIADSLASTPKLITYQKRMTKRRYVSYQHIQIRTFDGQSSAEKEAELIR